MDINQEKIEAAIVEQAVDQLVNEDDLISRINQAVTAKVDKIVANTVATVLEETVLRVTKEGFEREYTRRDNFGRAIGEPTTISKELDKLVQNYWEQRVDRSGKATSDSYNTTTRAQWMMTQICAEDFSKEMKQHVVNVAGALKDHFRSVLDQHISSMLSEVFKVNSLGDQERNPRAYSAGDKAKPIGG